MFFFAEDPTNSGKGGTPSCGRSLAFDVWFKAEVPDTGNIAIETFAFDSGTSYYLDTVITTYTQNASGYLTEVGCHDNGGSDFFAFSKAVLTGLTPNKTIYIRVWEATGLVASDYKRLNHKISAYKVTPPDNDNFENATPLSVGSTIDAYKVAGSIVNTTNSEKGGTPNCGRFLVSDVWYTAEVPPSGNISLETFNVGSSSFNSALTVYTKDASDNLTEVICDDNGGDSDLSKIVLAGQTAGKMLYIRVWGYKGERNAFEITAWDKTPLSTIEHNDQRFVLHPNPTAEQLYIQSRKTVHSVKVYNLTGAMVLSTTIAEDQIVDVRRLTPGVYLAQLEHENGNTYQKFIKE